MRIMEIRQLRYFTAIVEEGTVTGAAKRLNMTQPPLTAQLHALESELGCQLFERNGRRLRLTEAGRMFNRRARTILGLCDAAANDMADYRQGMVGTLRLGIVSSVRTTALFKWMKGFAKRYPAVRYDLSSANTYQLIDQMQYGQLDAAIVRTPFSAPGLKSLPLRREKMLAVGNTAFFSDSPGREISLPALAKKPLILYRRWENVLRNRFEVAGCVLRVFCLNDDAQMTLALAENGLGVGILPASALSLENTPHLETRTVDDAGLTTEIVAMYRDQKLLPQCTRCFLQYLRENFSYC